jgi:hypothetical protein
VAGSNHQGTSAKPSASAAQPRPVARAQPDAPKCAIAPANRQQPTAHGVTSGMTTASASVARFGAGTTVHISIANTRPPPIKAAIAPAM